MPHVDPETLALLALGESADSVHDDAHLRHCAPCRAELGRLTEVVSVARTAEGPGWLQQPPAPAADLRRAPRRTAPWWRRPLTVAVAALIACVGAVLAVQQLRSTPGPDVVARIALRPLPQFPQWQDASGNAVMERDAAGQLLKVTVRAPQRHGFYEDWLLARDGVKMISLGDLNRAHAGVFALPPGVDLSEYSRIDVSLQPFSGSTLHSSDSVVRGSLP